MASDVLTDNGLPVEAQPWARARERFERDYDNFRQQLATNSETAIVTAGNAVTAAANSVQQQLAAQAEMRRIPATLDASEFTVTPSTYFDSSGTPWGRLDVAIVPSDLDVDGNLLIPVAYQVWGRVFFVDPGIPVDDQTTMGFGPPYQMLGTSPTTNIQVNGLQVGVRYQIRVCAVSAFSVASILSSYVAALIPDTLAVMTMPDAPVLSSGAGMLIATWNGQFGASLPPSQFRYIYAEVSPHGANTWERKGNVLGRGGGTIQISGLTVNADYDVRLIAVDSLGADTDPSDVATITVVGISADDLTPDFLTVVTAGGNSLTWASTAPSANGLAEGDLWFQHDSANSIIAQFQWVGGEWIAQTISHQAISSIDLGTATVGTLNGGLITAGTIGAIQIVAGSITVNQLSPTVGRDLDLSANGNVTIIAGQVADLTSGLNDTSDSLDAMQTVYTFGPSGAVITNPGSPFQLALRSDRIEMLESGAVVSYWNSGQMHVTSFVGREVVLGKHKLEPDSAGTGTVVRAL